MGHLPVRSRALHLARLFAVGSHVLVTRGPFVGSTGVIVLFEGNDALVLLRGSLGPPVTVSVFDMEPG